MLVFLYYRYKITYTVKILCDIICIDVTYSLSLILEYVNTYSLIIEYIFLDWSILWIVKRLLEAE